MPSGHIRKRGENSYTIILDEGRDPVTGKRVRKQYTYQGITKRQARDKLHELVRKAQEGELVEPSKETVGEFLTRWLSSYARHKLSPRTYESYEGIVRRRLIPALGQVSIQRLRPAHVQSMYADMLSAARLDGQEGPVSAKTVLNAHRVLHRALEIAVKWQVVPRNIADAVDPPKPGRFEPAIPDVEGTLRLLAAMEEHWIYPAVYLAVHTGLRRGEMLALRWEDVDLDAGVIRISRSLHRVAGQGLITCEPKTARGRRTVAISSSVVAMLRKLRVQQLETRLALPEFWEDHGLVICQGNGRAMDPSSLGKVFRGQARKAGFTLRFHDLRHAHATLLLTQGVHPKVVQERLGHATISVTLDTYSHVLPGMQEAAAAKLDELLSQTKGRQVGGNRKGK